MSSQHKHKLPPDFLSFSETLKVLPTTPEVQVEETSTTGNSSSPFCHNNSTLFSNAREFTVKNSRFYSAPGASFQFVTNVTEGLCQNAGNLDFLGFPVCEDVELEGQLHKSGEYHLHRGRLRGKAVVVKVFKGPRAKQLCLKTAELNRGIMHSNVLRLIGGPDRNLGSSFLVFDGDFHGTAESQLAVALKGVKEACVAGANTVIACSLGLDYLQDLGLPLSLMGPEHFLLMLSKQNRMVLSFDPDITWNAPNRNNDSDRSATEICNELIQKTFYTSCKKYYQDQRLYDNDFDNGFDNEDDEHEENLVNGSRQGDALVRDSASPSGTGSSRKYSKGHRQELVWKAHSTTSTPSSLGEIGRHYQLSLTRFQSEDNVLVHRQGHSTMRTAHRCLGYKRTEIILAPDIERSSIVSHTSPLPNEICSVCGENVGKLAQLEAFNSLSFKQANGLTPVLSVEGHPVLPPLADTYQTSRFPVPISYSSNLYSQPRSVRNRLGYDLNPQDLYGTGYPVASTWARLLATYPTYEMHDHRYSPQPSFLAYTSRSSTPNMVNTVEQRRLPPLTTTSTPHRYSPQPSFPAYISRSSTPNMVNTVEQRRLPPLITTSTPHRYSPQPSFPAYISRSSTPNMVNIVEQRWLPPLTTTSTPPLERWQQPFVPQPNTNFYGNSIRSPTASYPPAYVAYTGQTHHNGNPYHVQQRHDRVSSMNPQGHGPMYDDGSRLNPPSTYTRGSGPSHAHAPTQRSYSPPPASPTSSDEPPLKKKRRRVDAAQLKVLNETYARTAYPSTEERVALAKMLDMSPRSVQIWFQIKQRSMRESNRQSSSAASSSHHPFSMQNQLDPMAEDLVPHPPAGYDGGPGETMYLTSRYGPSHTHTPTQRSYSPPPASPTSRDKPKKKKRKRADAA